MENSDGNFYIMYRGNSWFIKIFDDNFITLYHDGKNGERVRRVYRTLKKAEESVLEEIRKDKYPIVIKEYK
jgi:hypothetical protein